MSGDLVKVIITLVLILVTIGVMKSEPVPIRINCGSDSDLEINGVTWESDRSYTVGQNKTYSTDSSIDKNEELHQIQRFYWWPGIKYNFNLDSAGTYIVNLYFAEIIYNESGKRQIDVVIQNIEVFDLLDIWNEAGAANKELKLTYSVTVTTDSSGNNWLEIWIRKMYVCVFLFCKYCQTIILTQTTKLN